MSVRDPLKHYVNTSTNRLCRIKHGVRLEDALKSQQSKISVPKHPSNEFRSNYKPLNEILKSGHIQSSKAMKDYQMQRSFSEKLESHKHENLSSFFAEKYKYISFRIGDQKHSSPSSYLEKQKSSAAASSSNNQAKPKNKLEILEMKMKNIDKEVIETLGPKEEKARRLPDNLMDSIDKLRKSSIEHKDKRTGSLKPRENEKVWSCVFGEAKARKKWPSSRFVGSSPKSVKNSSKSFAERLLMRVN